MAVIKCKMCGGTIEFEQGATVGVCDSCGTKQTLPRIDDDRKANLYDRANHFRRNNDFDKAMGIYEQILNEDNTDAEAYWSLVLCCYGIEYVEDPATNKRIPTVNRAQYTSIYMDEDYKSAIQYADAAQKVVYEEEAKAIDDIQKGILEISQKEEPFDVFISFKETGADGRRTRDAVLAHELYNELIKEGYKVFFAPVTLEDKLGEAYEPYIFAALNSAKVMVVVGTKPEHFNAVWVKNEWSRYLALIKNGAKKTLIPAYKDMDPYDLPDEFSHLMAQDMSKLGFMQDLIRGIKKLTVSEETKAATRVIASESAGNTNVATLLKRVFIFLEDGDWDDADAYCEKVLDIDPVCAEAYLGKLMAELKVKKRKQLSDCKTLFDGSHNYRKIMRFGDDNLVGEMRGYISTVSERIESERIEDAHKEEEKRLADEKAAKKRKRIISIAAPITVTVVLLSIATLLKPVIIPSIRYHSAVKMIDEGNIVEAYESLISLNGYKNSAEKASEIYSQYTIKLANVGDIVPFGSYEQDNNTENGKETIEWRVLAKEDNKMLLISDKALDWQPYNGTYTSVTWEKCALRGWLNGTFLNDAFSIEDQAIIQSATVTADKNPQYSTSSGNDTTDKVFLLSITEAEKYFASDGDRMCVPTDYAVNNGAWTSSDYSAGGKATCWWWLRSPGRNSNYAASVNLDGSVSSDGCSVGRSFGGVRPALWIEF